MERTLANELKLRRFETMQRRARGWQLRDQVDAEHRARFYQHAKFVEAELMTQTMLWSRIARALEEIKNRGGFSLISLFSRTIAAKDTTHD